MSTSYSIHSVDLAFFYWDMSLQNSKKTIKNHISLLDHLFNTLYLILKEPFNSAIMNINAYNLIYDIMNRIWKNIWYCKIKNVLTCPELNEIIASLNIPFIRTRCKGIKTASFSSIDASRIKIRPYPFVTITCDSAVQSFPQKKTLNSQL